jgi:hypothetical protein
MKSQRRADESFAGWPSLLPDAPRRPKIVNLADSRILNRRHACDYGSPPDKQQLRVLFHLRRIENQKVTIRLWVIAVRGKPKQSIAADEKETAEKLSFRSVITQCNDRSTVKEIRCSLLRIIEPTGGWRCHVRFQASCDVPLPTPIHSNGKNARRFAGTNEKRLNHPRFNCGLSWQIEFTVFRYLSRYRAEFQALGCDECSKSERKCRATRAPNR